MPELSDDELRTRYRVRRKTPAERAAPQPAAPSSAPAPAGSVTGAPSRSVSLPTPTVSPARAVASPTRSVVTALLGAVVIFAIAGGQLSKRISGGG